jgi:microcin C transport system substrate-binding protein
MVVGREEGGRHRDFAVNASQGPSWPGLFWSPSCPGLARASTSSQLSPPKEIVDGRAKSGHDVAGPAPISRRSVLAMAAAAAASALPSLAAAAEPPSVATPSAFGPPRHGMSAFGDLAYPPDFSHFAYADPAAPKGGTLSQTGANTLYNQNFTTFDSLNIFILKGDGAFGMELTFTSLMARDSGAPDAMYGLAAESVAISGDGLAYRFRLRPAATFQDGSPLTAKDVVFSIQVLKAKGHPLVAQPLRFVTDATDDDGRTVTVRFASGRPRDLPLLVAGLPIFSAAYYAAHKFEESTLTPPLGSGLYKVGRLQPGRFIELERIADHWSAGLPVMAGQYNFDRLRFEYFRDRDVAFQGFKSGAYLFHEEFSSRVWARGYDFPAVKDGRVKREEIPDRTPSGAQGWLLNTRRPQFADVRTREALGLAFDFEWTNKNLMFGSYRRTRSFFENSDLMADGPPSAAELALLAPFRARLPPAVFGPPIIPPVSDGTGQDRALLRSAVGLLREAGWTVGADRVLRDKAGKAFTMEFLDFDPALQPHTGAYIKNRRLLGIQATSRIVDPAQYNSRVNRFDFDATTRRFSMAPTPGEELRLIFGSAAAKTEGSNNLAGVADPVIDALIAKVIDAETRQAMTTACRALDRVIRAGRYWVPQWYKPSHWLAYWDVYGHGTAMPRYDRGVLTTWWWDAAAAQKAGVKG